jgi:hypothetical protein
LTSNSNIRTNGAKGPSKLQFGAPKCAAESAEWRQHLEYNPETGEIFGPKRGGRRECSARSNRYRVVVFRGRYVAAHHVAWFLHHGEWPTSFVDHINHDGHDNRIANLRLATHAENTRNKRNKAKSGFKGVYFQSRPGRTKAWRASICIDGKTTGLGCYVTPEEAARAYDAAAIQLHGEFACTNEMLGLLPGRAA